jgi:branched-chain amino acid transport system ATP-binding protein
VVSNRLVERDARVALDICHRAYVFEIGRIALSGKRAELLDDARVKKAYLGA